MRAKLIPLMMAVLLCSLQSLQFVGGEEIDRSIDQEQELPESMLADKTGTIRTLDEELKEFKEAEQQRDEAADNKAEALKSKLEAGQRKKKAHIRKKAAQKKREKAENACLAAK